MKRAWLTIAALFAALLAVGCGPNTIGSGPCEGANPAPSCGATCTGDQSCDPGYYCNAQNACFADCTPGGNECGGDGYCDNRGRCQSRADGGAGNRADAYDCPSVAVAVAPQIPTVQLLIDQSGSMTQAFGNVNRWQAVNYALGHPTDGVVAQLQDRVKFGATLYTSHNGTTAGGICPELDAVSPGLNNYTNIADLLANNVPQDDTPTAPSITAVAAALPPVDPQSPGPRIIVLATDGDPDTCTDPDPTTDPGKEVARQDSVSAAQASYNQGIPVFVLSVGNDVTAAHLRNLANAGQGYPIDDPVDRYYVANNPADLVAAFNEIIRGARSCSFSLDGAVSDPTGGVVELNNQPLDYNVDWTLSNATTLELLGAACDTFLNDDNVSLTAVFECDAVVIL